MKPPKDPLNVCICPGCGNRIAKTATDCRKCTYDFSGDPGRPWTIREMLNGATADTYWDDVSLEDYTRGVLGVVMRWQRQEQTGKRVPGLNQGGMQMRDDFDEPMEVE